MNGETGHHGHDALVPVVTGQRRGDENVTAQPQDLTERTVWEVMNSPDLVIREIVEVSRLYWPKVSGFDRLYIVLINNNSYFPCQPF